MTVREQTTPLSVPDVAGLDTLAAALAYAAAGWYVGPARSGTKRPGSRLGDRWHEQTSRNPEQLVAWFAGTDDDVFLHCGRSGAVVLDVDTPDKLHPDIEQAVAETLPPFQTTRPDQPGRAHYVFGMPPGRLLGNSVGTLASGWGEVRGANGVVIVQPSVHRDGGRYEWGRTGLVPVLPEVLAAQLPDALASVDAATDEAVATFLTSWQGNTRPELLEVHVRAFGKAVQAGESRHHTMTGHLAGAMKEAVAGLYPADMAANTLESLFTAAVTVAGHGKQGGARSTGQARSEWAGLLAWAVAQAQAADPEQTLARVAQKVPPRQPWPVVERVDAETGSDRRRSRGGQVSSGAIVSPPPDEARVLLGRLLEDLRGWHHLPDPSHVALTLAAAVTRNAEGEPCWLLLVAPPSSGKTEAVRLLDAVADDRLDEVTAAGLLGWSKGKSPRPAGVLSRAGEHALVTIGDLSTLLATSDRGGRDQVFALLRRAYDGHVTRDVSPPGRVEGTGQLSWSGRLTVVGCVTGAIDRAAAHADALGPRWLYVRLPERDTAAKRQAAQLARAGGLAERRTAAADVTERLVKLAAASVADEVTPEVAQVIEDAALVTTWGRAAVPRNGYGRRDIEGVPVVEEPMRLVQQLDCLGRGLTALGLPEQAVGALVRRVALDSMPEARRAVLAALATGELLTTAAVARAGGLHRHVARMTLEELAAVGVVEHDRQDDEAEELVGAVHWSLAGDDGALIAEVFAEHNRCVGWHESWLYTSTTPQIEGGRDENKRFHPTLRATPDRVPEVTTEQDTSPDATGADWFVQVGRPEVTTEQDTSPDPDISGTGGRDGSSKLVEGSQTEQVGA